MRIRFWQKSLVTRFVVTFLLLSLATVAVVGSLAFLRARSALEASILDRLQVTAHLQEDALDQWVGEQLQDFLLLADLPPVRSLVDDLLHGEALSPGYRRAYAELSEVFAAMVARKPAWREILLLTHDSEILICTDKSHEGDYRILDRFFTSGLEETYLEKVYPSPLTFQPTITVSTPLLDSEDPRRGVLAVHLSLEQVDEIILERKGLNIASRSYLVDEFSALLSGDRFGSAEFARGVSSAGIDAALDGRDGAGLYLDHRGEPVLGVYRWIEDLNAALLTEIDQREAFDPARRLARATFLVGLVVAVLLTLGTYLLARQIARPILEVKEAALRVADGDLHARAAVVTEDEVGVLARSFNEMTGRLRDLYRSLEDEISERKQIQTELEEANVELETTNAELERYSYTVSHDLKSPLVTIRGFLGLLQQDIASADAEAVNRDIERITAASETMRLLLNDLLELSRIGRLVNPPEEVPLAELIQETLDLVAGQISERPIEIDVEAGELAVYGDRLRLLEVFQNLIVNAIKFSWNRERPRIELGARQDGDQILCHVRDHGVGIDPRYHENIFGLFNQLDQQREGTGIGLALVKRIVEVHGGRIWVESQPDQGATFWFTLPRPGTDLPQPIGEP